MSFGCVAMVRADRHALLLAAGELRRHPRPDPAGADALEDRGRAPVDLGAPEA
jgi:hypothetical protein